MSKLEGKVALVTGAAVGAGDGPSIGSAIAFRFASEGARIVVVDLNETMGRRTAERIAEAGGEAFFVKADVTDSKEVQAAIRQVDDRFGRLHCLVNCVASYEGDIFRGAADTPEEDWLHAFEVNLHGYYRFAKQAVPLILRSGGGTIINMSSMAAFSVTSNSAAYSVTKAAVNSLTRTLAIDCAPNIRTNAICPGVVRVANAESGRSPEEVKKWLDGIAERNPLKRVCTVDEIASVALFLASDESSFVNGECLQVDGGRVMA